MGLSIRHDKGRYIPVLTCDGCHELIEDWKKAVVTHSGPEGNEIIPVAVYHKVKCDPSAAPRHSDEARMWEQLNYYLPQLLWNHDWGRKYVPSQEGVQAKLAIDVPDDFAW